MAKNKVLIMIPTYNERENIRPMLYLIAQEKLDADVLFVDDNSPDGTGHVIEEEKQDRPYLSVLHRNSKDGVGSAHQAGIAYAYAKGYHLLVTMDSDFSHSPAYIKDLLNAASSADIVVGSRYLQTNSLAEWSVFRKLLTHTGHLLTRTLLGLRYDASNAFRLYNLKTVDQRLFELVKSKSYSFFFESLFLMHKNRVRIEQIPISLPKRTYGRSKMSYKDIYRSLRLLLLLFFRSIFFRKTIFIQRTQVSHETSKKNT